MEIVVNKVVDSDNMAIGIENNKVYFLINGELVKEVECMSTEALTCEPWVPEAVLNMQIADVIKSKTVDEEFNKLVELLD